MTEIFNESGSSKNTNSDHAAKHINGGDDQVDGDRLHISEGFNNFSPDVGGAASDTNDLTAHLRGIDNALGPPRARMYAAGSQAINDNVQTLMTGFTKHFESVVGMVDVVNSKIIIPEDGDYRVTGAVRYATSSATIFLNCSVTLNGSSNQLANSSRAKVNSPALEQVPPCTAIWPLSQGDDIYLYAYYYYTGGSNWSTGGGGQAVYLEVDKIGPKSS